MYKLKQDCFRKARGGKAFVVSIYCAACGTHVIDYQKDGDGQLKRCYLNRILAPENLEALQRTHAISEPQELKTLFCANCGSNIGSPIRHHDGRLAFKLRLDSFRKKRIRNS